MLSVDSRGRVAHAPFRKLKDSKKLSPSQRELWARTLAESADVRFAIARIYPRGIERLNISAAANRAALRAFSRLAHGNGLSPRAAVYLDGGLFLGSKARQRANTATIRAVTVIKGDEKISAVAAASIIAKVSRDAFMGRLAKRRPGYGFEVHKGYGTAAHLRAIERKGPCDAHRLTFLKGRHSMNK
jgi:ribonuclease HII